MHPLANRQSDSVSGNLRDSEESFGSDQWLYFIYIYSYKDFTLVVMLELWLA